MCLDRGICRWERAVSRRQVRSAAGGCRSAPRWLPISHGSDVEHQQQRVEAEVPLRWLSTTVAGRGLFAASRPLALAPTCRLLKNVLVQRQV